MSAVDLAILQVLRDSGMIEASKRPALAREPFLKGFVFGQKFRQEFQRDPVLVDGVLGKIDLAHSTPADFFKDPVFADVRGYHR